MKALVIDASALVDSLGEPALAAHALKGYVTCAPGLVAWEVGNVIHCKHPSIFGDAKKRKAVVRTLVSPLRLVDQSSRLEAIADLADSSRLSFYDASYLQLAIDENGPLLTQDKKLLAASAKIVGVERTWSLAEAKKGMEEGRF